MWIERPPAFFRAMVPGGIFRMPPEVGVKSVYLTFDDGPIPEMTPWVLDMLEEYDIKATFFMVGDNARRYPYLVDRVRGAGHAVGNHTMHHLQGAKVSTEVYMNDVIEADRLLRTPLFRPPHGWLRPAQARELARGFKIIMYDLVTRDYSKRLSASDVVNNVKRYTRPGSIIVFHDSLKSRPRLLTALPQALEWLRSNGYEFKTLM